MGLKPKNKGHANLYECFDLTKKVYLMYISAYLSILGSGIRALALGTYLPSCRVIGI